LPKFFAAGVSDTGTSSAAHYLPADTRSDVMVVNVVCSCEPMRFTAVMIAIQMAAVMRPYSMAVAPDSS
jgi:hypothetical protein